MYFPLLCIKFRAANIHMWFPTENTPFSRSTWTNICGCTFVRLSRRCLYLARDHQLHQASSRAEEGHGVLVGEPHQRLPVDHEELISGHQPAIPAETEWEHGAAGWFYTVPGSRGVWWDVQAWATYDLTKPSLHWSVQCYFLEKGAQKGAHRKSLL